jgi:hypothetical protein
VVRLHPDPSLDSKPDLSTAILFSPTDVEHVLAELPSVAAQLPAPGLEGQPSAAFSTLRKTDREVYRWIANTHYEHLADVVARLEHVYAAGCEFGTFLTTRDREQFVGLIAEVLVADDLLLRGYSVRTIGRSSEPTPDLHVAGDGVDVVVEVYSPRELIAVDEWLHEVSDLLNYVDVRASYTSRVETRLEQTIPPPRVPLDPWTQAEMLAQTRDVVIGEIARDVEAALGALESLSKVYPHPGTPMTTAVELDDVKLAPDIGPIRQGSISVPGFSGYSPTGVFGKIVDRSQRKARRRQAHGFPASARALVVYMMGTRIAEDLVHPVHAKDAEAALAEVDPQRYGLDAIAFVVRATSPRAGLAAIFTVADDTTLTTHQVRAMFAPSP